MDQFDDPHALMLQGEYEPAADGYGSILARDPQNLTALQNRALCCYQIGQYAEALAAIERLVALSPSNPSAQHIHGLVSMALGDEAAAIEAFENSARLNPENTSCLNELGNLYLARGLKDRARSMFAKALELEPDSILAAYNLGVTLQQLGDAAAAADLFETAIRLKPDFAEAHCNLGLAFVDQGRFPEGLAAYNRAIELRPDFPEAYANMSKPLVEQRRLAEAEQALRTALTLRPDYVTALENHAAVLKLIGDIPSALQACDRLFALDPLNRKARVDQINMRLAICDWAHYDEDSLYLRKNADASEPFVFLNSGGGAAEQLGCAKNWAAKYPRGKAFVHPAPKSKKKLKIGYLSADYRRHATAYLISELFERHDKRRFEVFGFSIGYDDESDERRRLVRSFDHFIDLKNRSHAESAQIIFDNKIDILVDLKGYTGGARAEILVPRPAPIQVSYLGYPGTMGAEFIDYIISDSVISPEDHKYFYSEAIARLPFSYQPNDTKRAISPSVYSRNDFGLPDDGFVFCSFNGAYKFNPVMFDIWMRLLSQTPSSVLWLLHTSPSAEQNLQREAAARGVDPARLVFTPPLASPDHLARHVLADLFLDTLPINAHTTASDALWAGLPVLTVLGDSFVGRVAASLLKAVGLPELVAGSLADYEAIALALAHDPGRMAALKAKLAANRAAAPLFAIDDYTRHLEAAFLKMWEIHASGQGPTGFGVEP